MDTIECVTQSKYFLKFILDGALCESTGWGWTSNEGHNDSDELLVVTIPIVAQDVCNATYGGGLVNEGMVCAGEENKNGI